MSTDKNTSKFNTIHLNQPKVAEQALKVWAQHCANRAKLSKGPSFTEPELLEIRLGWDRIVKELQTAREAV